MSDFVEFIENNLYLLEFFSEFPLKLMELAFDQKVAEFHDNDVVIDMHLLNAHIHSPDSMFNVDSVSEFIEALAICGFSRLPVKRSDERTLLRFKNPSFKSDEVPSSELFKQHNVQNKKSRERATKPIAVPSSQLIENLIRKSSKEIKMTKLEFSRLMVNFHLECQQKSLEKSDAVDVTECDAEQPEYSSDGTIAGYYGAVSEEQLKKAFGNYLPIITEASELEIGQVVEIETDVPKPKKTSRKRNAEEIQVEVDEKITQTPKRKYKKRARNILDPRETQDATDFLQKENYQIDKAQILEILTEVNAE